MLDNAGSLIGWMYECMKNRIQCNHRKDFLLWLELISGILNSFFHVLKIQNLRVSE